MSATMNHMHSQRAEREPSDRLWKELTSAVRRDAGAAAKEHLAAGRAIYYSEADTPAGLLVKEHPDGRRELVRFNETGDQVIRPL